MPILHAIITDEIQFAQVNMNYQTYISQINCYNFLINNFLRHSI